MTFFILPTVCHQTVCFIVHDNNFPPIKNEYYNNRVQMKNIKTVTQNSPSLYLDIETNVSGEVTVIGMYARGMGLVQLVRPNIDEDELMRALPKAKTLYTYNGHCFDLPILRKQFGVDLREHYQSVDLRFACQKVGWKGGLKKVEQQLGIKRKLTDMNGYDAVWLWEQYWIENDSQALKTLLVYNREDVMNLVQIRRALARIPQDSQSIVKGVGR